MDVSRSPFIKERIDVMYEGDSLPEIYDQTEQVELGGKTFKVIFVKTNDLSPADKIEYDERRVIEREIGLRIEGEADVNHPQLVYGIVTLGGRWYFGSYHKNKATWFRQMKKPRSYSIALSTCSPSCGQYSRSESRGCTSHRSLLRHRNSNGRSPLDGNQYGRT